MLWLKSFHIIAVICWFAGLFYLPRLFVYHSMATDEIGIERFKVMESKLYRGIMTPSMLVTIILGIVLLINTPEHLNAVWFHVKLALVGVLIVYHFYCGHYVKIFKENRNQHSHIFYRVFNEVPAVFLIAIIILIEVKPF
jgi:putative membrane protein